ncbi:rhodanese-like domain-containing protein [Hutsoniella sourekii]|uniref:rhodanese-like domain-containing protein n=1 Tax=Hutsoniella sourekii TaxID=87650 RepID=UPI000484BDC8|nr:rhodanese-like domain-containing protein [Hutsoniella sourekii]
MKQISINDFYQMQRAGQELKVIDVRPASAYSQGHVPAAINIPLEELEDSLADLDHNETYYLICRSGNRSKQACQLLDHQGYQAINITEGTLDYPGELEK